MVPWEPQSTEPATGNHPSLSALGFSLEARAPMGLLARLHVPHPLPEPSSHESSHQDPEMTGVPFAGPPVLSLLQVTPVPRGRTEAPRVWGSRKARWRAGAHLLETQGCLPQRPRLSHRPGGSFLLPCWEMAVLGFSIHSDCPTCPVSHGGAPCRSLRALAPNTPGRDARASVCTHSAPPPHPEEGGWV